MKKTIYSSAILFLAFFMVFGISDAMSQETKSRKAYIVRDGVKLFETEITNIDSIMFVPATFYTITYHANGGTITVPAVQKVVPGSMVNIAEIDGYDPETSPKLFNGWNTQADGKGGSFVPGFPISVTENMNLYAEWIAKPDPNDTLETNEWTVTLKRVHAYDHYCDSLGIDRMNIFEGLAIPERLFNGRLEKDRQYVLTYKFKLNVNMTHMIMALADYSIGPKKGYHGDNISDLEPDLLGGGSTSPSNMIANTEVSSTMLCGVNQTASNSSDLANCIWFNTSYGSSPALKDLDEIILTISELTLAEVAEVKMVGLIANGSVGLKTTQITMIFDKPIDLTLSDIFLSYADYSYKPMDIDNVELAGYGTYYTLTIKQTDEDPIYEEWNIKVRISGDNDYTKRGYRVTYAPDVNPVKIYTGYAYTPEPPVAWIGYLTANGNHDTTTTQLQWYIDVEEGRGPFTITRDDVILRATDYYGSGEEFAVLKGTLSVIDSGLINNGKQRRLKYTLPISGFTMNGVIDIKVSSNNNRNWEIKYNSKNVGSHFTRQQAYIYYSPPVVNEDWSAYSYNGYLGRGYDILNDEYYNDAQVKSQYALNMKKFQGQNRISEEPSSGSNNIYTVENSIVSSSKSFNEQAKVSGGVGLFKASVSFGYSTSKKSEVTDNFVSIQGILLKQKHTISNIPTIEEIRAGYLDSNFKKNWLLNNSVTPEQLFVAYGTHIFLKVFLGGRMDMSYVYHSEKKETSEQIKVKVNASYGTIVNGESDTEIQKQTSEFLSKATGHVQSYGGSVGYSYKTFEEACKNYGNWAASIENSNNLQIVRAGDIKAPETEMIPIWTLAGPPGNARREAIKAKYDSMLLANGSFIKGLQDEIENLHIYTVRTGYCKTDNDDLAITDLIFQSPSGYEVYAANGSYDTPGNLAEGRTVDGKHPRLLIGYTETTDLNVGVVDIKAVKGPKVNGSYPATMKINDRLYHIVPNYTLSNNKNLYCCWMEDAKNSSGVALTPIKDIFVAIDGDTKKIQNVNGNVAAGWEVVKWSDGTICDTNKDCGGRDVHIWIKR